MTTLKLRSEKKGDHIHLAVFVGSDGGGFARAGELTFREAEYRMFKGLLCTGVPESSDDKIIWEAR